MRPLTLLTNIFSEPSEYPTQYLGRCLRRRLNTNQCQRCVESCPSGALSVNNREIVLNEEKCTGCMACTAACPQDALESECDVNEVVRSCEGDSDVVITCTRQKQNRPDEIVLPCVAILSKQVLLAVIFNNSKSVAINISGCAGCCNQVVLDNFIRDYKLVTDCFAEVVSTKTILVNSADQLNDIIVDRRLYLTNVRKFVADVSQKSLGSKRARLADKKESTRRTPMKVRLVKNLVVDLDSESRKKLFNLFNLQLSINDKCNICPLCKGICPTGAIQIERSEGEKGLKFYPLDCNGCGLCVEFCKKDALSIPS